MSQPNHIDTKSSRFSDSVTHHAHSIGAHPFVAYADKCVAAMADIESVVGLLRWNQPNIDCPSDENPPVLSAYDTDNMLGLIQVAAQALIQDGDALDEWAQRRFVNGGKQ